MGNQNESIGSNLDNKEGLQEQVNSLLKKIGEAQSGFKKLAYKDGLDPGNKNQAQELIRSMEEYLTNLKELANQASQSGFSKENLDGLNEIVNKVEKDISDNNDFFAWHTQDI